MSNRTERREAERLARKLAYKQRNQPAQTQPKPAAEPLIEGLTAGVIESAAPVQVPESPVSAAQFAANRANALASTGPTSDAGKAIASRNHTTHGLTAIPSGPFRVLHTENQKEFDDSLRDLTTEWSPASITERNLVDLMATHFWLYKRADRFQSQIMDSPEGLNTIAALKQFNLFARYASFHLRGFNKAFSDLLRLRNFQMRQKKDAALIERRAANLQIRFESQKQKAELHAAKLETIRIKQEAQKQRNQRTAKPEIYATPATGAPEIVKTQAA